MIYSLDDKKVEASGERYFVAPSAQVIGMVRFGVWASVWFNCVIRGDNDWIILGDGSNVQDGTIIHCDGGMPVELAPGVSIGHGALLHSCRIGARTLIANRAVVLDGVTIGEDCIVAAGALVPPGKSIPSGSVAMGSPAKVIRETTPQERLLIGQTSKHYQNRGRWYLNSLRADSRSFAAHPA